ncbi:Yea4p [Sugiyamaella lignohabitans]|uniref:Yea4p n=1 Tax=Sugiyamaella lignohabitans TaxID=796027 RepID=A0A170R000_9ASCO|nr:Yea4p [Sugiyamaella lignohabitans]ANB16028.1 Yea4p [Sugiyamaella lignohabitans]
MSQSRLRNSTGTTTTIIGSHTKVENGPEDRVTLPAKDEVSTPELTKAIGQVTFNQWVLILSLIFGGCCSNVFALESIVREAPNSGHLITFVQFLFVASEGYVHFFDAHSKFFFLQKPHIPVHRMLFPVIIYFTLSVLNNYVWAFHISIPMHIIFRSSGTVITMIFGALSGKRYTTRQIFAVIVLTAGIILATLYGNPSISNPSDVATDSRTYATGIAILMVGSILGAFQGVVTESTYKTYGRHWRESLFYTHFLSLLFFIPMWKEITNEFLSALNSQPVYTVPIIQIILPRRVVYLAVNGFTQYVCVRGVNNLAGHVSALTVTIVLNIRKFVSLAISVYLFGNDLSVGMIAGSIFVFLGAFLYSSSPKQSTQGIPDKKTK